MKNRLKEIRRAKGMTQREVATYVGITQNAYHYWENGKVRINNDDILKLSDLYGVSTDFLSGREYVMNTPPERWSDDDRKRYLSANECTKLYMEYLYGDISYVGDDPRTPTFKITEDMVIYHRDGATVVKRLSKEHIKILQDLADSLPDDDDEENRL